MNVRDNLGNSYLLLDSSNRNFEILVRGDVVPFVISDRKPDRLHPLEDKPKINPRVPRSKQLDCGRLHFEREISIFALRGEVVKNNYWKVTADVEVLHRVTENERLVGSEDGHIAFFRILRASNDVVIWAFVGQQVSQAGIVPFPRKARQTDPTSEQPVHRTLLHRTF